MTVDEKAPTCTTCLLCLRLDYGYSNWTTEGAELYCLRGLNPGMIGMEDSTPFYGDLNEARARILDFAQSCPAYRRGAPVHLDVDRDGVDPKHKWGTPYAPEHLTTYTDDPEALQLLTTFLNTNG